ncbi:hypothetical protein FH144_11630 [Staphylococcus caledonicus]|uniref:hypothetical protein n=1 Tax=Staphylococcus sp. acrmy TaxID=2929076 RepID=UPI001F58C9AA|nr:hypothetical protein [Staphylococcus sp. acrmy]MCI2949038.1 hypothetical protein [Staphylococcus sp. acrmy]
MAISFEEQLEMKRQARKKPRPESLAEKWRREEEMNRKLGLYKKTQNLPNPECIARKVSDEELNRILTRRE